MFYKSPFPLLAVSFLQMCYLPRPSSVVSGLVGCEQVECRGEGAWQEGEGCEKPASSSQGWAWLHPVMRWSVHHG